MLSCRVWKCSYFCAPAITLRAMCLRCGWPGSGSVYVSLDTTHLSSCTVHVHTMLSHLPTGMGAECCQSCTAIHQPSTAFMCMGMGMTGDMDSACRWVVECSITSFGVCIGNVKQVHCRHQRPAAHHCCAATTGGVQSVREASCCTYSRQGKGRRRSCCCSWACAGFQFWALPCRLVGARSLVPESQPTLSSGCTDGAWHCACMYIRQLRHTCAHRTWGAGESVLCVATSNCFCFLCLCLG